MKLENIKNFCSWYFYSGNKAFAKSHSKTANYLRNTSYIFFVPPIFVGLTYGFVSLIQRFSKTLPRDVKATSDKIPKLVKDTLSHDYVPVASREPLMSIVEEDFKGNYVNLMRLLQSLFTDAARDVPSSYYSLNYDEQIDVVKRLENLVTTFDSMKIVFPKLSSEQHIRLYEAFILFGHAINKLSREEFVKRSQEVLAKREAMANVNNPSSEDVILSSTTQLRPISIEVVEKKISYQYLLKMFNPKLITRGSQIEIEEYNDFLKNMFLALAPADQLTVLKCFLPLSEEQTVRQVLQQKFPLIPNPLLEHLSARMQVFHKLTDSEKIGKLNNIL